MPRLAERLEVPLQATCGASDSKEMEVDARQVVLVLLVLPWLSLPRVHIVAPLIANDIRKHETCEVDAMLEAFLGRCSLAGRSDGLLPACLEKTVELANRNSELRARMNQ